MKILFFPETGQSIELDPGNRLCWTVGRAPSCEVRLDHAFISAKHFRIQHAPPETHQEEGRWDIRDLRSTNGTYLNGRRLPPDNWEPLELQDRIQAGKFLVVFMEKEDTLQAEESKEQPAEAAATPPASQTPASKTYADVLYGMATWATSAPTFREAVGRLLVLILGGIVTAYLLSIVL